MIAPSRSIQGSRSTTNAASCAQSEETRTARSPTSTEPSSSLRATLTFTTTGGNARLARGDRDGAIADYTEAVTINPRLASVYANRAVARHYQGDLKAAIADCNRAIELAPEIAVTYNTRGMARRATGDLDGAIADYDRALALDPALTVAYMNRGFARLYQGNEAAAEQDFARALALRPDLEQRIKEKKKKLLPIREDAPSVVGSGSPRAANRYAQRDSRWLTPVEPPGASPARALRSPL
jgi:tetratricopeptide (TPR) repeat protein